MLGFIGFIATLAIGVGIGYVYHDNIDSYVTNLFNK